MLRKYFFIIVVLVISYQCDINKKIDEAIAYNDSIVMRQDTFYQYLNDFLIKLEKDEKIELVREAYNKTLQYAKLKEFYYRSLKNFDKDDILRDAIIKFYQNQIKLLETKYDSMIIILSKPQRSIKMKDQKQWEKLMKEVIMLDSIYANEFRKAQEIFAKKYEFQLKEID